MLNIIDILHSDYRFLKAEGYKVFGVFLVGSQNYGLATPSSDIDRKAIVIPSLDCLLFHRGEIEKTYHMPDGGELCVKDICSMFRNIFKQNMNFVEMLFTDYFVLSPEYGSAFHWLEKNRERIAHYSEYQTAKCMQGIVHNQYHKLFRPMVSNKERVEQYRYDGKALSNMYRIEDFLHKYLKGVSYKEAIVPKDRNLLLSYKSYEVVFDPESLYDSITQWLSFFDAFIDTIENVPPDEDIKNETEQWIKNLICDCLREEIE